jgi:hypothetical protein
MSKVSILLFSLFFTKITFAQTTNQLNDFLVSNRYKTNFKNLKNENYFVGTRIIDSLARIEVNAFEVHKKLKFSQLRFNCELCPKSKVSKKTILKNCRIDFQKIFANLFSTSFPKSLQRHLEFGKWSEKIVRAKIPSSLKSIRFSRNEPYCDATRGGASYTVDFFYL